MVSWIRAAKLNYKITTRSEDINKWRLNFHEVEYNHQVEYTPSTIKPKRISDEE